jgi:hypothetical protein
MTTDILDEMTREELVDYIRASYIARPSKSHILFQRYNKRFAAYMKASAENSPPEGGAERDALARLFNASTDPTEKFKLAKQLNAFQLKINAWLKRHEILQKEYEAIQQDYAEYYQQSDRELEEIQRGQNEKAT